ncbi:glycosyl hydrolase [Edaphobacter sp.]|uniref:glycosyl hydrolase n=1 Tax=Edaphobacter sp. TaxID=1934404 RepID=UPI002DBC7E1C|nr:glycosyl hydrolase [Edaphobacter sp.]HEU5341488.1 glycosyl hydrolase [Edaphobacter sp.]
MLRSLRQQCRPTASGALLVFFLLIQAATISPAQTSVKTIEQNFQNPPAASRPMVRWWWFGLAVQKPEILRELQQMKADGIQGAELAFEYPQVLDDPAKHLKNLPFLSLEFLDDVRYAQEEGRKLGLRIDVTLGSGWPYGGPNTTLAEAAGRLRIAEVQVPASTTSAAEPQLGEGESFISAAIANAKLLPPETHPRGRGHLSQPRPADFDPTSAKPLTIADHTATFPASDHPRVALFFIASHTRQQVKRAAVGAEGYVLDPFSHQAVATHLEKVGEPLVRAFGNTPPYAIFSDSLEAYGADWTPNLPAEFLKQNGYDLIPHLPELVAGGTPEAERVRHDWGKTLTKLINENYLTQINNWAIEHNTKFRSQTYGEPAVSFSSQNLVALAEGEGPQWRQFSTLRWATSANHVFNHTVTSGETFTWLHSPVFRATPLDMKTEADTDFLMGENQIMCHGWPYSPPDNEVPEPGWSLYAAAALNDHNPWHPVMPDVTSYIGRISYLLRQGKPANQVAVLLPTDDAWAGFSPGHVTVTGAMQRLIPPPMISAILSAGYNYDFIDADAIDSVGLGTHQILVLPPTDRIPVETLHKISTWVQAGGKVISLGHTPTLDPEGKPLTQSATAFIPTVPDATNLGKALADLAPPDFKLNSPDEHIKEVAGFIRRKLPDADIYFVANTGNIPVTFNATFATTYKFVSRWNPDNGTVTSPTSVSDSRSSITSLAPYGSAIFIFSDEPIATTNKGQRPDTYQPGPKAQVTTTQRSKRAESPTHNVGATPDSSIDLTTNWRVNFTSLHQTQTEPTLTDWTASPATLYYSGEAIYSRDVTLAADQTHATLEIDGGKPLPGAPNSAPEHPALLPNGLPNPLITRPGPGMHAYYDPPIHEAAIVYINGQRAGALWHPPYSLDVSKFLKPGKNHIEIHVYNTALNAWFALPPHDYKPLIAKYGDRFQMQDLDKVKPIPSGILGTIRLMTGGSK